MPDTASGHDSDSFVVSKPAADVEKESASASNNLR